MNYKIPAVLLLFITASTRAQTNIPITDFSFEGIKTSISSPGGGGTSSGAIGAWTGTASTASSLFSSASIGTTSIAGAPNGTNVLSMHVPQGLLSAAASDTLSQTLAANFATNSIYKLTFYLDSQSSLSLLNSDTISLTSGGTTVAHLSGSSFTSLLAQNTFSLVTLTYTNISNTADTGPIGINFNVNSVVGLSITPSANDANVLLDDFQLQWTPLIVASPTPEPSNASLLGLSLGALVFGLRQIVSRPGKR